MHEKKVKDDIFGTQKKLPIGPADYEVKIGITKTKAPALGFDSKNAN